MIPDVLITSRNRAGSVLMSTSPGKGYDVRNVISIGEVGSPPPTGLRRHTRRVIRLEYDDVEYESPRFSYRGTTWEDTANLVKFCRKIATDQSKTLVHCAQGIRRSTASATVLFAVCLGPGGEDIAVECLLRARDWTIAQGARATADVFIQPNRRVVYMADLMLGLGGALLNAVEARPEFKYRDVFDRTTVAYPG